jgi:hypothetical protein
MPCGKRIKMFQIRKCSFRPSLMTGSTPLIFGNASAVFSCEPSNKAANCSEVRIFQRLKLIIWKSLKMSDNEAFCRIKIPLDRGEAGQGVVQKFFRSRMRLDASTNQPPSGLGISTKKHQHDLSDEELVAKWVENPYRQFFSGMQFFPTRLPSTLRT